MNKWETLRDLFSIQERVNRLFEDALGGSESAEETSVTWSPAVDIYETEQGFTVEAEVPEVNQAEIEIRIQDNSLTIEGERRSGKAASEGYHRVERAHGRFHRSFLLPCPVLEEGVKATLRDGVLKIVLPKKVEAEPKQISISGQE